jgi:hypothetical protein
LITSSNSTGCSTGRSLGAGTFKDAIDITCAAPVDCGPTRPVTDEATAVQPATPARLS